MEKTSSTSSSSSSKPAPSSSAKANPPASTAIKMIVSKTKNQCINNNAIDTLLVVDNHLKVKRCKHGRIIVKDTSKKRHEATGEHTGPSLANKSNVLVHSLPQDCRKSQVQLSNQLATPEKPHPTNHKTLPKTPQLDTSPKKTLTIEPSTTPPIQTSPSDNSPNSDIYDPEGPIIPMSPVDSPPLSLIDETAYNKIQYRLQDDKSNDDDVPSSAVSLNQQEKYLQKLNRQERVIEEVKIALKPYYQKRHISKEQYKDVLRRAVPKICHSKNGEINPVKIQTLVEAYVRELRRRSSFLNYHISHGGLV